MYLILFFTSLPSEIQHYTSVFPPFPAPHLSSKALGLENQTSLASFYLITHGLLNFQVLSFSPLKMFFITHALFPSLQHHPDPHSHDLLRSVRVENLSNHITLNPILLFDFQPLCSLDPHYPPSPLLESDQAYFPSNRSWALRLQ